jgi:hypothetical protein
MAEIKISPKELVLVRKTRDIMLEHRGKRKRNTLTGAISTVGNQRRRYFHQGSKHC